MCSVLIDYEAKTCLDHSACVAPAAFWEIATHRRRLSCRIRNMLSMLCRTFVAIAVAAACAIHKYIAINLFINIFPVKCHRCYEAAAAGVWVNISIVRDV